MKWIELSVDSPPEFVEPLTEIFYKYGHGGVAIEEGGGFNPDEGEAPPKSESVRIKTYLPIDSTTDDRRARIDVGVRLVAYLAPISGLRQAEVDEKDWQEAWKQHFHVLKIGRRTVIVPTWRQHEAKPGEVVIELDRGMAFGTGHHPTTRMCLQMLEETVQPGCAVLDVGSGSGILSISAAKLGASSVVGLEIDEMAATVANRNVAQNGVSATTRQYNASLPDHRAPAKSFDIVVANISAKVVKELSDHMTEAAKPGGRLIVSGVLAEHADGVAKRLEEAGANVERTEVDGDWVCMLATVS